MTIKLKRFIIIAFLSGLIGLIGLLSKPPLAKAICLNRVESYQTIQSKFTRENNLRVSVQTISNYKQPFQYTITANLKKAVLPAVGMSTSLFLKITGVICILTAAIIYFKFL